MGLRATRIRPKQLGPEAGKGGKASAQGPGQGERGLRLLVQARSGWAVRFWEFVATEASSDVSFGFHLGVQTAEGH